MVGDVGRQLRLETVDLRLAGVERGVERTTTGDRRTVGADRDAADADLHVLVVVVEAGQVEDAAAVAEGRLHAGLERVEGLGLHGRRARVASRIEAHGVVARLEAPGHRGIEHRPGAGGVVDAEASRRLALRAREVEGLAVERTTPHELVADLVPVVAQTEVQAHGVRELVVEVAEQRGGLHRVVGIAVERSGDRRQDVDLSRLALIDVHVERTDDPVDAIALELQLQLLADLLGVLREPDGHPHRRDHRIDVQEGLRLAVVEVARERLPRIAVADVAGQRQAERRVVPLPFRLRRLIVVADIPTVERLRHPLPGAVEGDEFTDAARFFGLLPEDLDVHGTQFAGERQAAARELVAIDLLAGHPVSDATINAGRGAGEAQRPVISQGRVQRGLEPAQVVVADLHAHIGPELLARPPRDDVHRTAGRIAPVQRALWSLQHLDAVDIEHPTERCRRGSLVDAVDVRGDRLTAARHL